MSKKINRENDTVEVAPTVLKSEVSLREEAIQKFWVDEDIFNKSLEQPGGGTPKGEFVFYDGPPFATGTPHYGHILAGTIKDAIPRFWTMNGYRVQRKWGWDCHGLPLENLIEKKLGLANKRDIEDYGIKNFNEAARNAVMEYADDWKKVVPRLGRWADMENDYKTMDTTYTESVWWAFKSLHEKGLVYEGFKSMHLCPRCGTTLSNFEVNLGYKDIKDVAVTVKLPLLDDSGGVTDTSLLVWTTTPWTLPGNMAAAVHQEIKYVKIKIVPKGNVAETNFDGAYDSEEYADWETVIIAKDRLSLLNDYHIKLIEEMNGVDLVGRSYQPPFAYIADQDLKGKENAFKIYHADYVEIGEEGTGAVHIAPAYGEEDLQLAQKHGVPIFHHVDYEGRFMNFVTDFAGDLVKPKDDDRAGISHLDADIEIIKALKVSGKLLKKENITHSYPHCWRDETPLLNYATTSWFVRVTNIKDDLVAANNKVKWVPDHVGSNRFGRWLEGARDWAISRQRYWGAPLPIWKNPTTGEYKVFGSLVELKQYVPKSGNQYIVMRHGEAESNLSGVIDSILDEKNPLTKLGREQCVNAALELKDKKIDLIIHSGMQRTRDTALLIAQELGIPADRVIEDGRMMEIKTGEKLEGKLWSDYNTLYASQEEKFTKVIAGVENRLEVKRRVGEFLYELDKKYQNKKILIVGHASSTFSLRAAARGMDIKKAMELRAEGYVKNGQMLEVEFTPLPHNEDYELDFHRPYIDELELVDTDGTKLERVPDVFDCWFESGSMPYAQHHYPFENQDNFLTEHFPAQFIAEGLDQTRGWFYSLIVLGVALFGKSPYENVIVNGLVLAEDGKKMSKSLSNYPDPMELVDKLGADSIRYYLLSSPVMRGEDLSFSEKEVLELQRKNIGRLHNVLSMYQMFADGTKGNADSKNVLDRWILSRLGELVAESTVGYRAYELDRATRPIADFIEDLSVWYLRRSRERLKGEDAEDKAQAIATLRHLLMVLSQVMAPAMPFYAEYLYLAVKGETDPASVHLSAWPTPLTVDVELLTLMKLTRELVSQALELRTKSNLKVRQPLAAVVLNAEILLPDDLKQVIKEELNVKEVVSGQIQNYQQNADFITGNQVALNIKISPELKAEGEVRAFIRSVQQSRKDTGLNPNDKVILLVSANLAAKISGWEAEIKNVTGAVEVKTENLENHEQTQSVLELGAEFIYLVNKL